MKASFFVATLFSTLAFAAPTPDLTWDNTAVVCAVNKFRAANGKPALKVDPQLSEIAQSQATELSNGKKLILEELLKDKYKHKYGRFADTSAFNFNWKEFEELTQTVDTLKANLLGDFNVIGVANAKKDDTLYVVESFVELTDKDAFDKLPEVECKN
ncbi:hypothetical protein GQ42DRAFT_172156 [Ramicandelaber brevisporus]|nr:hypothetical protein GQ42DRAFT_172156 [Ramicandelaber brevisporus]